MVKKIFFILIFSFIQIPINLIASIDKLEVKDNFILPILPNWSIDSSIADFPYRIFHESEKAELNIFMSLLEPNERIHNNKEFKAAVEGVIDDILLTLPDTRLMINSGFFEEDHLSFELQFISPDTNNDLPINHSIKSFIFRLPDDYQVMYTLWGQTHGLENDLLSEEIKFYQDNFTFTGDAESRFYPKNEFYKWITLFIAVIIFFVGIYLVIRKNNSKTVIQ